MNLARRLDVSDRVAPRLVLFKDNINLRSEVPSAIIVEDVHRIFVQQRLQPCTLFQFLVGLRLSLALVIHDADGIQHLASVVDSRSVICCFLQDISRDAIIRLAENPIHDWRDTLRVSPICGIGVGGLIKDHRTPFQFVFLFHLYWLFKGY